MDSPYTHSGVLLVIGSRGSLPSQRSHLAYMVGFKAIGWYSIAECRATLALATLESKQFQLRMAFVSSAGGPFPLAA